MYKELKISFEEQDVILKPSENEDDVIILRSQELDSVTHFDLYLTKKEAKELAAEILKFIE